MKPIKLLQHVALYPTLRRFRCIKDIPKDLPGKSLLVSFGLWGQWYIVEGFHGLHCTNGTQMPFHLARFHDFGTVIGQRDLTAADGTLMEEAWRESMRTMIAERNRLHVAV